MLGKTLVNIRSSLGFKSAKSFFENFLCQKTAISFNYNYYMKIEGEKVIPSPAVVQEICGGLPGSISDTLAIAYCKEIFPQKTKLFERLEDLTVRDSQVTPDESRLTLEKQTFLTPAQIAVISKTRPHYFAFLLLTLARFPISLEDLKKNIPGVTDNAVQELVEVKIAALQNGNIQALSKEKKFPPSDRTLEDAYAKIDLWHTEFDKQMGFKNLIQKMLLRRVSKRYMGIILNQFNNSLDLIRASDETDQQFNDEVLVVNLTVSRGRVAG